MPLQHFYLLRHHIPLYIKFLLFCSLAPDGFSILCGKNKGCLQNYNCSFFLYHSFLTIQHKILSQRLSVFNKELVFQSEGKRGDCPEVYGFHQNKNLQRRIFSHWICSRSSKAKGIIRTLLQGKKSEGFDLHCYFLMRNSSLIKNHSLRDNTLIPIQDLNTNFHLEPKNRKPEI